MQYVATLWDQSVGLRTDCTAAAGRYAVRAPAAQVEDEPGFSNAGELCMVIWRGCYLYAAPWLMAWLVPACCTFCHWAAL
jgi:hypothetical protein